MNHFFVCLLAGLFLANAANAAPKAAGTGPAAPPAGTDLLARLQRQDRAASQTLEARFPPAQRKKMRAELFARQNAADAKAEREAPVLVNVSRHVKLADAGEKAARAAFRKKYHLTDAELISLENGSRLKISTPP